MSISLMLIGVISLIVIAGIGYLFISKNQDLTSQKKGLIVVIVGAVIFLSFLVTTFKHRNIGFKSSQYSEGSIDVTKVFFGGNCQFQYDQKYDHGFQISQESISEMYKRNHISLFDINLEKDQHKEFLNRYQQNLLFLSKKNEGASYYLNKLSRKICKDRKNPVIYLNLDRQITRQSDFLNKIGVQTFEQIQRNYCHFSKIEIKVNRYNDVEYQAQSSSKKKNPYLVIDNFQFLLPALAEPSSFPSIDSERQDSDRKQDGFDSVKGSELKYVGKKRLFDKILKQLGQNCKVNIVLNTEKESAIEDLYQIWSQTKEFEDNKQARKDQSRHFPFEYRRWEGLKQYDLFKIISQSVSASDSQLSKMLEINKQDSYTFQDLFNIVQQLKIKSEGTKGQKYDKIKQGKSLEQWDVLNQVARYYKLDRVFKFLRSVQNKKIGWIKEKIRYDDLIKLEEIKLIEISNGKILIR